MKNEKNIKCTLRRKEFSYISKKNVYDRDYTKI